MHGAPLHQLGRDGSALELQGVLVQVQVSVLHTFSAWVHGIDITTMIISIIRYSGEGGASMRAVQHKGLTFD